MKKHRLVVLVLAIILLPFLASAQTNTTLIQLKAQVARLQATLRSLTSETAVKPIEVSPSLSSVSSLNNQITAKVGRIGAAELKSLLIQRKSEMLNLAKINPRLFLNQKLSPAIIQQIPQDLRINLEQPVSLTGRLEVMHIDDFENPENSRYDYSLVVGRDKYALYSTQPIPSVSGAVLAVSGSRLDKILVVEAEQAGQLRILTPAPPPDSVGEQKTLVLLIDFLDSGPRLLTPAQAYDFILNPNSQFQKFYKENSYGKISFSGDTKGWYRLNRNTEVNCNYVRTSDTDIQNILREIPNLSNYGRLVFLFGSGGGNCSSVGKVPVVLDDIEYKMSIAWVSIDIIAYLKNNLSHLLAHEMGHSLGVMHANGWDCGVNILQGDCQHIEYGNHFDVMGRGSFSLHFNAFYKELLGWIQPSETIQISSSGRYTLNPLELSSSSKKLAKVQSPYSTSTTFYLEYRRGVGFDEKLNEPDLSSNQQGLFVNKIIYSPPDSRFAFPRLLDMRPTALPWESDLTGATLNSRTDDPGTGISIGPILLANDLLVTFDVEMTEPQCARNQPSVWVPHTILARGNAGRVNVIYHNSDSSSCGGSNFRVVKTDIPPTWQPMIFPEGEVFLPPDLILEAYARINFVVPVDTPLGLHSFTVEVINSTTNYKTIKTFWIEIINRPAPPIISSITPQSGPVGTDVTISGANFSQLSNKLSFIDPTTGNYFSEVIRSSNDRIIFTIPEFITNINCQCPTPTLPGRYKIVIIAGGGDSEPVDFEVTSTSTTIYTITASAGAGGTIMPSGVITVNAGASKIFTITPTLDYQVSDVLINGLSVGAVTSYTFSNVHADQTINANFSQIARVVADPPDRAIDARENQPLAATVVGWKSVDLTFHVSTPLSDLTSDSFSITSSSASQPKVGTVRIVADPLQNIPTLAVTLTLTRPIQPGERLTITHKPSGVSICLGFLPGDVNQDGRSNATDIGLLRSWVGTTEGAAKPLYQTDTNRDGVFDAADTTRLSEVRADPNAGLTLPACPSSASGGLGASPIANQSQLANLLSALRAVINQLGQLLMSR